MIGRTTDDDCLYVRSCNFVVPVATYQEVTTKTREKARTNPKNLRRKNNSAYVPTRNRLCFANFCLSLIYSQISLPAEQFYDIETCYKGNYRGALHHGTVNQMQALLKEALDKVVFIPFSPGTMSDFEYSLHEKNLPRDEFNKRWWEVVRRYQGIVPPEPRGEQYCDACTKTHINDDPASYYDYAISLVLLFQMHDYIARNILRQNPHATNYYGSKAVGDFLRKIMAPGASRDWRTVLRETTGEELNAKAMLRYFEPLVAYLTKVNAGRKYTLEELPAE